MHRHAPIGFIATLVNTSLVTTVLWRKEPTWQIAAWFACQLAWVAVRQAVYLRLRRQPLTTASDAQRRLLRFRMSALISGFLWGASAVFLFPLDSLQHQIFLAFVLGGMVAGASGLFALDLTSFFLYAIPSLTPVAGRLLAGGETPQLAMGAMVCLFGLLFSWTAHQNNRSLLTSLRLQVENVDLIASLTAARDRAEGLNRDLGAEIVVRERAEQALRTHRDQLEELVADRTRGLAEANSRLQEMIADREQAQHQASRVAAEWMSTFDNMLDMVAVVNADLKITRANAPLARFLSMHPDDLVGKDCHQVFGAHGEPWTECPHREALRTNAPVTREVDDPQLGVPLLVTCSPFSDSSGKVIGTVHIARDIAQLRQAVARVKLLSGLLPICSACKKIRDDDGYWTQIEAYIREHSAADFSHGICPACATQLYPEYYREGSDPGSRGPASA